ncbi:MAG: apolipoprotein N-acyltransferase [Oscillospiraceae bacterium]
MFAGLLESSFTLPFFCIFTMLPLFTSVNFSSKRRLVVNILPFLAAYDLTKTSFLLTVYRIVEMPLPLAVGFSLAAAVGAAMILLIPQVICLSFFCPIRTGRARDIVSISLLFSASEWLCENSGPLSFPWLGVWAQADGAEFVFMTSRLLGCRFTSFLILLANGLVYLIIKSLRKNCPLAALKPTAALSGLALFVFLYGFGEIQSLKAQSKAAPKITVMTVQLDCEGREKNRLPAQKAAKMYATEIDRRLEKSDERPDMIMLPETAVNTCFAADEPAFAALSETAKKYGCVILTGCFFKVGGEKFNSVIAVTPDGISDARYFKTHLVPFGESSLSAYSGECRVIEARSVKTACGICVESIYSDLFTAQLRSGARLVYIPTNDSWFGDSSARRAHYVHAKMRAAETGRYVVRSGNCGISAVISPWCEEAAKDESKNRGTLVCEVALLDRKSVYSTVGDCFIIAPLILVIISSARTAKRRLIRRNQA